MPRITTLTFTKSFDLVVDALAGMVKDPVITESEENGHRVTLVEGAFSHFVLEDMENWECYLRFEIKENDIQDESDRDARAFLSTAMPGFGAVLFSPVVAFVYRRVQIETRTKTVTERRKDGELVETKETDWTSEIGEEWEEITREFSRKVTPNR